MRSFLSVLAAAAALSIIALPSTAPAAGTHKVVGTITGKHVGTVVEHFQGRTVTLNFNAKGKLVNASESAGHGMVAHGMTITKSKNAPPGPHKYTVYYDWCYYWVCDADGYCYIYYYVC